MNNKYAFYILGLLFVLLSLYDFITEVNLTDTFAQHVYSILVDNLTLVAILGGILYLIKFIYDYVRKKINAPK